jgi:UDP-N-acetylmuramate dehydrogenase
VPDLRDLTTLRVGGSVGELITAGTESELIDAVRAADDTGSPVLLVGGGSNLVISDDGWPGTAILIRTTGITTTMTGDAVMLTAAAGEPWAALVDRTLAEGISGLESLAGIPGLAGATPVQNVGAYGTEISQLLTSARVFDRSTRTLTTLDAEQCAFGYRTSMFKHSDRYVVIDVTLALHRKALSRPIGYAELARVLGVDLGATAKASDVRDAVLQLRHSKGMVLDAADHDTWSVGSFFTNPLMTEVPPSAANCPNWPTETGVKLSAAWLIEQAGFARGYRKAGAAISTKHTLALTNLGDASATDVVALAAEIVAGVRERFGVDLQAEPRLVGVHL